MKMMNVRQMVGCAVTIIGVVLVGYGIYWKSHISVVEAEAAKLAASSNRAARSIGKEMESLAGGYRNKMFVFGIAGLLFIVAGSGSIYYYRKD